MIHDSKADSQMSSETGRPEEIETLLLLSALNFIYGFFTGIFWLVVLGLGLWQHGIQNFFTLVTIVLSVIVSAGNILSARLLQIPARRQFSFLIAAFNCLYLPFGTLLGAFTIYRLLKPDVVLLYENDVEST